jgi:hypothetical protein
MTTFSPDRPGATLALPSTATPPGRLWALPPSPGVFSGVLSSGYRVIRCWAMGGWVAAGLVTGCQGPPVDIGDVQEEEVVVVPPPAAPPVLPAGAVIDLGSEVPPSQTIQGFSMPERVGARLASWSEGAVSTIYFDVQGGADRYIVAFLAEPYHMLGEVPVGVSLNGRSLMDTTLANGWRGYGVVVGGDRIGAGKNQLSFRYAKRGRPNELNSESSDVRDLSVRFDQVQVQPITLRAELSFGCKNALALAALGEGWARDPNDRGTGTWTVGKSALITFHLVPPVATSAGAAPSPEAPGYTLTLTARTPRGVAERRVSLKLNGAPLGPLTFHETKGVGVIDVPAGRLKAENVLALEFARLESPAQLDPSSKDTRLLGLRVFELDVAPGPAPLSEAKRTPDPPSPAPPESSRAREPVRAAARK